MQVRGLWGPELDTLQVELLKNSTSGQSTLVFKAIRNKHTSWPFKNSSRFQYFNQKGNKVGFPWIVYCLIEQGHVSNINTIH